jgi:uncharacterized repeat protein (TIGR03809 family)
MTLPTDVVRGRDLLACWRELAEKRLEYLTEMFESGRWRRYYREYVFLENIREAKSAVETWRGLSTPDLSQNTIIDISWFAPERGTRPRQTAPRPEPGPAKPPDMPVNAEIPVAKAQPVSMAQPVSVNDTQAAARIDMLALQRAIYQITDAAPDAAPAEGHAPLRYTL